MEKFVKIIEKTFAPNDIFFNEMLSCEFRGNGELWLHIEDVRDLSLGDKLYLLKDGFKKLAHKLKTDKRFRNINLITGTSWLIAKNPRLLEKLGFTVSQNKEEYPEHIREYKSKSRKIHMPKEFRDMEPGHAYIGKDKFLQLYENAS